MSFLKSKKIQTLVLVSLAIAMVSAITVLSYSRATQPPPSSPVPPPSGPAAPVGLVPAAGKEITWSQERINTPFMVPGDRTSVPLAFVNERDLNDLRIEPVPEVAKFVTVAPNAFVTVPAGQQQSIVLTFSVPAGTRFGAYEGTIHVREGKRTLPATLKVMINVGLPPDPGDAGKATLEGIDSDANGVRDDIQRYVALSHPGSARTRAALTSLSQSMQLALVGASDKRASTDNVIEIFRAKECLSHIRPEDQSTISSQLRAQMLNTLQRSEAWILVDKHFSGQTYGSPPRSQWKLQCRFDPDTMEN